VIDLVVAGGGPAGLVTALHAARAGLDVVVVEPRSAPVDKACGEGLMPGAVAALAALGVHPSGRPFRGIAYLDATHRAVADFPSGPGLGVRRTTLQATLLAAVEAAGISVIRGRIVAIEQDEDGVFAGGLRARWLVGADGLHSSVRALAGLAGEPLRPRERRWGVRAHFAVAPWSDRVEVHWARSAEAYVTPVADDLVGVAVLSSQRLPFAERLAAFPALRDRLPADPVESPRAAGPLRQRVSGSVAGRVVLVGDAAGYVDALTGEGMAVAFAEAAAAVARLGPGDPAGYEDDRRRIVRPSRLLTEALLHATARPIVRRHLVAVAARQPWLFRRAVAVLAGDARPPTVPPAAHRAEGSSSNLSPGRD
jgi:flavin-dependent dehydrogenase